MDVSLIGIETCIRNRPQTEPVFTNMTRQNQKAFVRLIRDMMVQHAADEIEFMENTGGIKEKGEPGA